MQQVTEAILQLQILDTAPEEVFDNVVALACMVCNVPAAALVLAHGEDGWIKAKTGIGFTVIKNFSWLLQEYSAGHEPVLLNPTGAEQLFAGQTIQQQAIRFYAGMPVYSTGQTVIGHLCLLDYQPRTLTAQELTGLKTLGRQLSLLLANRLQLLKQETRLELKNSEEQIGNIFYNAVNAVVVMNSRNLIVQWNPKAEALFGWTGCEAAGKDFYQLCFTPEHRDALQSGMAGRTDGGETIEVTAVNRGGNKVEIDLGLSSAIINGNEYFIAFVSNITHRKQIADQLDKQKEFYENILNKLPTDIAVFDASHKYLFVNPGAISNAEFRKFIIGKNDYEYAAYRNRDAAIADIRRERFLQVKNSGKEIRWEDSLPNPEGKIITHLRRMFPVHDENGDLSLVIGFGIDITDRKLMEEKQSLLVKQLSAQNAQLIDFCNIVSHNLRGPLVNMSMLVDFIRESDDEEEQKHLISKLSPVIDNLHTTFNELVESIQIKQDLEIKCENLSLKDCVQRTLENLETEITKTGAVIEMNFDEAPIIHYPPKYLFSICDNLIGNSLKYHSPDRKPLIELETRRIKDTIVFSVRDNGLGMDTKKHKDSLFKIGRVFHRHPNAKGFGLFMTKTQIEAMNGNIWVESEIDKGSNFFIEFKNQHQ